MLSFHTVLICIPLFIISKMYLYLCAPHQNFRQTRTFLLILHHKPSCVLASLMILIWHFHRIWAFYNLAHLQTQSRLEGLLIRRPCRNFSSEMLHSKACQVVRIGHNSGELTSLLKLSICLSTARVIRLTGVTLITAHSKHRSYPVQNVNCWIISFRVSL